MAAAAKNALSDIRYKLIIRAKGELSITDNVVAEDNPLNCTAAELAAFKAYRKAWVDIAFGDISNIIIDLRSEMLMNGFDHPVFPEGWCILNRKEQDLPGILVRMSTLDCIDPTNPEYVPNKPSPGPFSHIGQSGVPPQVSRPDHEPSLLSPA